MIIKSENKILSGVEKMSKLFYFKKIVKSSVFVFAVFSFFFSSNIVSADTTLTGTGSYSTANVAAWITAGGTLYVGDGVTATSSSFASGTYNLGSLNLVINGTLIPLPSSTTVNGATGVTIQTTGNITVSSTGIINGDGKGYAGGAQGETHPGYGEGGGAASWGGGGGGGHASNGGVSATGVLGGVAYGVEDAPVTLGSGGGGEDKGAGGAGGGAIKLQAGVLTNNGTISANGITALITGGGGGGAGGSIWILASTFTGSGIISASGGDGYGKGAYEGGGAGGAGRVKITPTYTDTYAGSIITAGASGFVGSAAGSLIRDLSSNPGDVTISSPVIWTRGTHTFHNLTISDTGSISTGIAQGSTGCGWNSPQLPAVGTGAGHCGDYGSGGGYGGAGGDAGYNINYKGGLPYGSATAPVDLGSGGAGGGNTGDLGGYGAGAIKIVITSGGMLTNNGSILADGGAGVGVSGGGSGGSIWIDTMAGTLSGSGLYSAKGGAAVVGENKGGGGGGGRIAFSINTTSNFIPNLNVTGGTAYVNAQYPTQRLGKIGSIAGLFSSMISTPSAGNPTTFPYVKASTSTLSGTAMDGNNTITAVSLSIKDNSGAGSWWNGTSFVATQQWVSATSATSFATWTYSGLSSAPAIAGHSFTVTSKATSSTYGDETPSSSVTFTFDNVAPALAQVTAVPTLINSSTPSYTFSSSEAGTISYSGSCSSSTTSAILGNNTITFNTLADATYSNCGIIVTDPATNASSSLSVNSFTIDTVAPDAPTAVTLTAIDGIVVSNNILNSTNTNFTVTANITPGQATGGHAELLKNGVPFSTPILDNSIAAGNSTVTFTAGAINNTQVQAAFASGATLSVRLYDAATNNSTSTVANPTIATDYIPPTNQNSVLLGNVARKALVGVNIISSGDTTNSVWFAPSGTTIFVEGSTMTKASGTATSILSPSAEGTYYLYVLDAAGNYSVASTHYLTVDTTAPIVTAPTSVAQILRSDVASSSTVAINESGKIYLIENGEASITLDNLNTAVSSSKAFIVVTGETDNFAQSNYPYTVTAPAGLSDGVYNIVGVDLVGNISTSVGGWLTVDNTKPVSTITYPDVSITNAQSFVISGTATDTNGVAGVKISIKKIGKLGAPDTWFNGTDFSSSSESLLNTTGVASWTYPIPDGAWTNLTSTDYTIKTYSTDNAGNIETALVNNTKDFTDDKNIPAIAITYGANPAKAGTNLITATYTKPITSIPSISVNQQGTTDISNITMTDIGGNVYTYPYVVHGNINGSYIDGITTVSLSGTADSAGNASQLPTNNTFVIDTSSPLSSLTPICDIPGNGCTEAGKALTPKQSYKVSSIAGTTSDSTGSGVEVVNISIKDTTGNYYNYNGDKLFSSPSEVYFPATLGGDGLSWSYDSSAIVFALNERYLIHSQSIDKAGNVEETPQALNFVFTNSPPVVSNVSIPSENSNGVVSVTYDVVDAESSSLSDYLFYGIGATLNGNISSSTTSITLSDTTHLPSSGTILIDEEMISYTGKSGNSLTGVTRGAGINYPEGIAASVNNTTTQFTHSSGADIYVYASHATESGIGYVADDGSNKTVYWDAKLDASGYQSATGVIKIVANDGATASMIGSSLSSSFNLDAAPATVVPTTSLLINNLTGSVVEPVNSTISDVTLKLQNVTGNPANENIYVQFSRDDGMTWYGANANGTLSGVGTVGSGFFSDSATLSSLSWPWTLQTRSETIKVKVTDSFNNSSTDINTVGYNSAPEFNAGFGTDGLSVAQIYDRQDANFKKVKIQYSVRDVDVDNTVVTPTFSYDIGSGYVTIDPADLSGVETSITGSYLTYTVYWTPGANIETASATFKLVLDDAEPINNTTTRTISSLIVDTKNPVVTPVTFDAGIAGSTDSGIITIPMPSDISAIEYKISDDSATNSNPQDTGWVTMIESTTIPWTFDSDIEAKTLKYQFRDLYDNTTAETTISTLGPILASSFLVQDTSNVSIPSYDMYIGWKALDDTTGFASYNLEYSTSTNNSTYEAYASVGSGMSNPTTNYYVHRNLNPNLYYRYRLGVVGTDGNTSIRAGAFTTAKPDGIANFGEGGGASIATASQVENVVPIQDPTTKNVTVSYKLTDASVSKKTNAVYEGRIFYNIGITLPTNPFVGGNLTVSDASKMPASGYIQINNEVIGYTSKTGNVLSGLTRGTWPTLSRTTRQNISFFSGTQVWVMASDTSTTPTSIANTSISSGQDGSIIWSVLEEPTLAGSSYSNVGIKVLVHDNQDSSAGPLSSQNDLSENGILNTFDLSNPTVGFGDPNSSTGLNSVSSVVFPIVLSRAFPVAITVPYTVSGTAVDGTDYTDLASGSVVINAKELGANITATILSQPVKSNTKIIVTLSAPTNATLGANVDYTYTIQNHGVDTTGPVVELIGSPIIHIAQGVDFVRPVDLWVAATDDMDQNVVSSVVVTGAPTKDSLPGTYTVTYTATDLSGNTGFITRTVIVDDPNAVTYKITLDVVGTHGSIHPLGDIDTNAILKNTTPSYDIVPEEGFGVDSYSIDGGLPIKPIAGTNHYTFAPITRDHTITVEFKDITAPVINVGVDYPVTLGEIYTEVTPTATDNLDTSVAVLTADGDVDRVNTNAVGTYIIHYTATDAAGNITTATRKVIVSLSATYDIDATVVGGHGSINPQGKSSVITGDPLSYTITPDEGFGVATILIDSSTQSLLPTSGVNNYTFGNVTKNHNITVTFKDITAPVISITDGEEYPITIGDTYVDPGATATDNLDTSVTVVKNQLDISRVNTNAAGTYIVRYTATDAAGNKATAERNVNVSSAGTFTILASSDSNGTIAPVGSVHVANGESKSFAFEPKSGFKLDSLIVDTESLSINGISSYTFTDVVTNHSISVTYKDAKAPEIVITNPEYSNAFPMGGTYVDPGAEATDNVDTLVTVVTTAGDVGRVNTNAAGEYVIHYTATDAAGNIATAERTVNVVQAAEYVITINQTENGIIAAPEGVDTTKVALGTSPTYTITPSAGYKVATLTVDGTSIAVSTTVNQPLTYQFKSVNSEHTITATYVDGIPPSIHLNEPEKKSYDVLVGDTYVDPGATATDNVDTLVTVETTGLPIDTSSAHSGYPIVYTATDAAGNTASETRTVNVVQAAEYVITINQTENGIIAAPEGVDTTKVALGTSPTYTITPSAGYIIKTLVIDDNPSLAITSAVGAPMFYQFKLVNSSHTITATYEQVKYKIIVTPGLHGIIEPGDTDVISGESQTFVISPETGFDIATLLVDNKPIVPAVSSYTFEKVSGSHFIGATFVSQSAAKPRIEVSGPDPLQLSIGQDFLEPGVKAFDGTDGTISLPVETNMGTFNKNIPGTYPIIYTATDSLGVSNTATRNVEVQDNVPPVITGITEPVKSSTALVITWYTDEPSTSQVLWGTETGSRPRNTVVDTSLTSYHVISLSSGTKDIDGSINVLTPSTPYFYTVKSVDAHSNFAESAENTVSTTAEGQVIFESNKPASSSFFSDNSSNFIPDTTAPTISAIEIKDITAFGANISFNTDKPTMSFVEYGKDTKYGSNSGSNKWETIHTIKLSGLKIGTDYHIKITAIDKAGNATSSSDKTFKTKFFSENPEELKTIENIAQFQEEIEATIESILPSLIPPFIEKPNVVNITENSATITYRTNIKAFPAVSYGTDAVFTKSKDKPYDGEISDTTTGKSFAHSLTISGLKANTKYHFMAKAFSLPQVVGKSEDATFTTLPSKISGSIVDRKKDSFVVTWSTEEPTTSIVDYKNVTTGRTSRIVDSSKNTSHSIKVENLTPGTSYQVDISGINEAGNIFEAGASLFIKTSVDITPPTITSVKVDSALVLGRTDKTQTIISWQTDEPSTSTVYYEEGSGTLTKDLANKQEDGTLTTNHAVVITALKPGTVYRFQVASTDSANNTTKPPVRTIITPRRTESIVDVILKNFNETFQFMNNLK